MRYRKRKIKGRTFSEHRLVYEQANGSIAPGLVIHHKNHDKLDNRPENLEALSASEHAKHHMQKHPLTSVCVVCGAEFTPQPTKRGRKKTCSEECRWARIAEANREKHGGLCSVCRAPGHKPNGCPVALGIDIDALRRAHAGGESLRSIGRRIGVHHSQVKRLLSNNEVWVAPTRGGLAA